MAQYEYDLVVIGAGSGGVRAARIAAKLGAKVLLAESSRLGGTCVIRGCIPKKLYVTAASFTHLFSLSRKFGWEFSPPQFSWKTLVQAKNKEIDRLESVYYTLLRDSGVEIVSAKAYLKEAHTVGFSEGNAVTAERILIATGGIPFIPEFSGNNLAIVSDHAFDLPEQPAHIVIQGGGYIACEFACIFNGLGTKVSLVYRGSQILGGFDREAVAFLTEEMRKKGINIILETDVIEVRSEGQKKKVALRSRDGTISDIEADQILCATGRLPNIASLGLETVGILLKSNGLVETNSDYQTSVPSVYAIGDIINSVQLTPLAIRQGQGFAEHIFSKKPIAPVDLYNIPKAVFSYPEMATVGLNDSEARKILAENGETLEIYRSVFRPLKQSFSGEPERVFMKMLVSKETRRVLGVCMVGGDSSEIIQGVAVAVQMGAKKEDFDKTMPLHPSTAEEFMTMNTPIFESVVE